MASVASQMIDEVTAHAQIESLEDAREICADGTYVPNYLRIYSQQYIERFFWTFTHHLHLFLYKMSCISKWYRFLGSQNIHILRK